jgi:hypothetical protein
MKKSILIACALCISIASYAQSKAPSKYTTKQAQKYTNEIVEYVSDVLAEQQKLIYQMNVDVSMKFDSLKKLDLEQYEYKAAARAIFKYKDETMKAILNESQFDEYLMMQDEKRQAYKNKMKAKAAAADSIKTQAPNGQ